MFPSQGRFSFPGSTLFHTYNIFLLLIGLTQIGLYASQGIMSSCSQMSSMFYGYMATEILTCLVSILALVCVGCRRYFNSVVIFGILVALSKIGVIASVLILSAIHQGLCYMQAQVRNGICIANGMQLFCLIIQLIFLVYIRDITQVKQIQRFLIQNKTLQMDKYQNPDMVYYRT